MDSRVPTGKPRGRPKGSPKTGGRVAKSLDRGERLVVNAQMAGDILAVYARLGGEDFLYRWAKENQSLYVTSVLSKLMPAAPKDGEADTYNTQINVNTMSAMEAARRVAFVLAKGVYDDPSVSTIEHEPQEAKQITPQAAVSEWVPPVDMPSMPEPGPVEDPRREQWASELSLSPDERRDNALVRQTHGASLETYAGGAGEQGFGPSRPTVQTKRKTAAELCRSLSRRGRDLM